MNAKLIALALAIFSLVGCSEDGRPTVVLRKHYPVNCKSHGRVVLAESVAVYMNQHDADAIGVMPTERTRLTCEDGTVALTTD